MQIYVVGVKEANVAQMRIVSSSPQLADNNYWYRNETTELADIVTPIRNSICEDPIEDIHGMYSSIMEQFTERSKMSTFLTDLKNSKTHSETAFNYHTSILVLYELLIFLSNLQYISVQ